MVIIQPSGGLCNRMRVINSSLELAKRKGAKLLVLWYCADELNAPFESLFQPVEEFKVINFTSLKDLRKIWYQLTARTRISNADIENHKTDGLLDQDFFDSIKLPAYIFTWEHFYPTNEYYGLFKPTAELQKRIDGLSGDIERLKLQSSFLNFDISGSLKVTWGINFPDNPFGFLAGQTDIKNPIHGFDFENNLNLKLSLNNKYFNNTDWRLRKWQI